MNRKHLAEHYRVYSNEIKPGITEEIKMSKKLVSDLLVDYLERRGVTKLFGLCGHTVIGMLDALSRSEKIEYIGTRHESVASTAADGYARVTHKASVVMCHLGPGLTNVITGVANASLDSIPMVVIAGDVPSFSLRTRKCRCTLTATSTNFWSR